MKPLLPGEFENFLNRFNAFKDGELRCINIVSPAQIIISLAAQDAARDYDWVNVDLEFNTIFDAKLIENEKLKFINLNDGISLLSENKQIAFALYKCYNISDVKNSACYVISDNVKFQEDVF